MKRTQQITEISRLRESGLSWQAIATATGLDKSYVWRLGTGRSQLTPRRSPKTMATYPPETLRINMEPVVRGGLSELEAAAELIRRGFEVWTPILAQQRADLAVFKNGRFSRIQVKTASWVSAKLHYRAILTSKKRGIRYSYTKSDCDFFVIKCGQSQDFYVIPLSACIGRSTTLNLYPNRDHCAHSNASWVEEYKNAFQIIDGTD